MGRDKHDKKLAAFLEYIRSQYCCLCGGVDRVDKYGSPRVTVSHVIKRGSTRRGQHYDNVVPMCMSPPHYCHQRFELRPNTYRRKFLTLAKELRERFDENYVEE